MSTPTPTEVLPHAQAFRAAGISCIPITFRDKRPLFDILPGKSWERYQKNIASPEEIEFWFKGREANIAVVGGAVSGNLVIFDFDDPAQFGKFQALEPDLLKQTLVAKSGKGYHVYLRFPNPVPKSVAFYPDQWEDTKTGKRLKRFGLDIQGEGSYVVAPPSLHATGVRYAWINRDGGIARRDPEWFRELAKRLGFTLQARSEPKSAGGRDQWVTDLLVNGAGQGNRNNALVRLGGYLRNHVPFDVGQAIAVLWNEARCDPPQSLADVERTVISAYGYGEVYSDKPEQRAYEDLE